MKLKKCPVKGNGHIIVQGQYAGWKSDNHIILAPEAWAGVIHQQIC